jgi:hypothetical protein
MKMFRVCALCLIGFLAVGAVIAWSTVALAFIRFYRAEGTLGRVFGACRQAPGPWLRRSVVALAGFDDLRVEQRGV